MLGWMPLDEILNSPMGYDPVFGDDTLCLCGHPYYRHFDTYEGMHPVGCKYCICSGFKLKEVESV